MFTTEELQKIEKALVEQLTENAKIDAAPHGGEYGEHETELWLTTDDGDICLNVSYDLDYEYRFNGGDNWDYKAEYDLVYLRVSNIWITEGTYEKEDGEYEVDIHSDEIRSLEQRLEQQLGDIW